MENNPDKGFAFGNVEYIDSNSNSLNDTWFEARPSFSFAYSYDELIKMYGDIASIFPFAGQIIRKELLTKYNFENCFVLLFDVYLWFSLMATGNKLGLINEKVANYRIHEGQLTSLSKKSIYDIRGYFETEYYRKLLFQIKDLDVIRKICNDSQYIDKLETEKDISFVLAEYLFSKYSSTTGYNALSELLNKEETMLYLREKFGYTIGNLRAKQYSKEYLPLIIEENWRKKARRIGGELNICQLIWLLIYKLTRNPFKKAIKQQETKKEYSL